MQVQFDSSTVSESADSSNNQRAGAALAFSGNDDENYDSHGDENLCKHCGSVVPPGSVLCPDCGCWWSR